MKYTTTLALLLGNVASRRQLPAMAGYEIGEGAYCRMTDGRVGRADEICKGCTASRCADECNKDSTCAGFDFHERASKTCWLHYDYPQKLMPEGCPECDCYLKSGFEGKGTPPQPKRPDHIEGFRFEQGRCMPWRGKGYMSSRWEVPGTAYDGIDYQECANRCRDRSDCAGFDIWLEGLDCQLFFDQEHFGDNSAEEECFINENFVPQHNYPKDYWGSLFDEATTGGQADLEEFRKGYKAEHEKNGHDPNEEGLDAIIDATFKVADQDQDGRLSRDEFMALRTYIGNEMILPFTQIDTDSDLHLDINEFGAAYRHLEPEVTDEKIGGAFKWGDKDGDGLLDWIETLVLAQEREAHLAREAAKKKALDVNLKKDIKLDGFTRFDGYCVREGETEARPHEDWVPAETSDFDSCAKGCSETSECAAFALYHEDGQCYFFQPPTAVSRGTGVYVEGGACFAKDSGDGKVIKPVLLAAAKDDSMVASRVVVEEGEDGEQHLFINGATKMMMGISISAAGLALAF